MKLFIKVFQHPQNCNLLSHTTKLDFFYINELGKFKLSESIYNVRETGFKNQSKFCGKDTVLLLSRNAKSS